MVVVLKLSIAKCAKDACTSYLHCYQVVAQPRHAVGFRITEFISLPFPLLRVISLYNMHYLPVRRLLPMKDLKRPVDAHGGDQNDSSNKARTYVSLVGRNAVK